MKRSEFVQQYAHARRVIYAKQIKAGELRPSEAAMGLADATADALRQWRNLSPGAKALPVAEFFSATIHQKTPWPLVGPEPQDRLCQDSQLLRRELARLDADYTRERKKTAVLVQAIKAALAYQADQFDGPDDQDLNVSGADLCEWFAAWRLGAALALSEVEGTAPPAGLLQEPVTDDERSNGPRRNQP